MKNKISVLHLHTDLKFLNLSNVFEGDVFHNTNILITNTENDFKVKKFNYNNKSHYEKIIGLCNNSDMVVLYNLDTIKLKLISKINPDVKIGWRFFGYELYSKIPETVKSELTLKFSKKKLNIKNEIKKFILAYLNPKNKIRDLNKTLPMIDFFFGLSFEEYSRLNKIWPGLPTFIKLPHVAIENNLIPENKPKHCSSPLIIIGNNRSAYNNHLDILKIIKKSNKKGRYDFKLFFSYGVKTYYSDKVRKMADSLDSVSLLSDFLPKEKFLDVYIKACALVINGYRQMAVANIMTALKAGVKVYLNEKNTDKQFLENQGFLVFSVEDFKIDLENENLCLSNEMIEHNINTYSVFVKSYSNDDFQDQLLKYLP